MSTEAEISCILESLALEFKARGDLLREVACSGVEFNGHRNYVIVQIDRDIWEKLQEYRSHVHVYKEIDGQSVPQCDCGAVRDYNGITERLTQ